MPSFLQLLARDLLQKHEGHFDRLTVVFPNKRAGLFLAEELSRTIQHPTWMPEICTLSEFVYRQTGLRTAEELALIIKLYKSYIRVSGSDEKFEDFYFWGHLLLEDFDDVDKYLTDAKDLFSNLVALKKLEESFPYLSEEQIQAIRNFWDSFNPERYSSEQQAFLKIWDKLYPTYQDFRECLYQNHMCYEGMGERYFYENLTEYDYQGHLVFAGFNALNKCEKQIFSFFRDREQASFYWDYDIYYTSNPNHEAGNYIRENLKNFPNALGEEHFNNFRYNGKQFEYISVPSSVGQAKLINKLIDAEPGQEHQTAIVLCDEHLLIPTLHSIPENIHRVNITMGYPAQNTSIAALVYLLGELKNYSKREKNETWYYYKPVIALLNHKLLKSLCAGEINKITDYINRRNIIYVAENSLHFNEITQTIFSSEEECIPDYMLRVLSVLTRYIEETHESCDSIEKEFIFTLYTSIQSLRNLFDEEKICPENKLYIQIINKVIRGTTIPFSGEPLEGLQIIGLMETRMIDFKNLIILSANEGILPRNTVPSSFIPYHLRTGFGLPTPDFQDSLIAYYFYRVLQRAKRIQILYTSGNKGLNSGEMSRFLYQIKYESGLPIRESNFQNQISVQNNQPISIAKNQEIQNFLEGWTQSPEKMLSPSALNIFMECPMRFYFRYIAGIQEKEELTEELDHRLLGNIFHECSQSLYATVPDGHITNEAIDTLLANDGMIDKHIRTSYFKVYDQRISQLMDNGSNELILNVIKKYLRRMLNYDRQFCPFQIIAMEQKFHVPITVPTSAGEKTVYVGGYIDRIDQVQETIRIIDYKTGADTTVFKNIPAVFDSESPSRNKAAFQTMLYCLMFDHTRPCNAPLCPGIYSTKLLFGRDYDYRLLCDKNQMTNFRHYEPEFAEQLKALLQKLFDPRIPFDQTSDDKKCRKCPYPSICRR